MKSGDLVRILHNDTFTFNFHANKPGIYLGKIRGGKHSVLVNTGKIFFGSIEGSFEQVQQS